MGRLFWPGLPAQGLPRHQCVHASAVVSPLATSPVSVLGVLPKGPPCMRNLRGWGCVRCEPPVVSPAHACGESLQESRIRYVAVPSYVVRRQQGCVLAGHWGRSSQHNPNQVPVLQRGQERHEFTVLAPAGDVIVRCLGLSNRARLQRGGLHLEMYPGRSDFATLSPSVFGTAIGSRCRPSSPWGGCSRAPG